MVEFEVCVVHCLFLEITTMYVNGEEIPKTKMSLFNEKTMILEAVSIISDKCFLQQPVTFTLNRW